MSPVPKSVSSPQIATMRSGGTPNCCSTRDSSAAWRCSSWLRAVDAARRDAGRGVFLEGLAEGAALAAVERQHGLVDRDAGEGLVDHRARHALRRRLARHRGEEGVEVAAALRGERGVARTSMTRTAASWRASRNPHPPRRSWHGGWAPLNMRRRKRRQTGVPAARASKCRRGRRIAHRHCRNKGALSRRPKRHLKAAGPSLQLEKDRSPAGSPLPSPRRCRAKGDQRATSPDAPGRFPDPPHPGRRGRRRSHCIIGFNWAGWMLGSTAQTQSGTPNRPAWSRCSHRSAPTGSRDPPTRPPISRRSTAQIPGGATS